MGHGAGEEDESGRQQRAAALLYAVSQHDVGKVEKLLSQGVDANSGTCCEKDLRGEGDFVS